MEFSQVPGGYPEWYFHRFLHTATICGVQIFPVVHWLVANLGNLA